MTGAGLTATRFPFLTQLTEAGRRELGALPATPVRRGQRLLTRGDAVGGAYFVVEGRLRVYYISPEGREATLYNVGAGGTCILALTACLIRVPRQVLRRLFESEPALRDFVFEALNGRVLDLMRALEETGSVRLEQRVARHLLRNADANGVVRQSQAAIAGELGTAREIVFRALRTFTRRGLIETSRARIQIVDRSGLAALGALD